MTNPPTPGPWPDPTGGSSAGAPQQQPTYPTYPASPEPQPGYPPPPTYPPQPGYPPPPGYAPPSGYAPYAPPPYAASRPTNSLALASMICSIAGVAIWISFPVGAVLGHMALKQIRETGEEGEGFAKAGIIVGWIGTGLLVLGCIGFIALIAAFPNGITVE